MNDILTQSRANDCVTDLRHRVFAWIVAAVAAGVGFATLGCSGSTGASGTAAPPAEYDADMPGERELEDGDTRQLDAADASDTPDAAVAPDDAVAPDAAAEALATDGGHEAASDLEGGGVDWLACMRASDEGFVSSPVPPFSRAQSGACTMAEIDAHRACLQGTDAAPCPEPPKISETCHGCLFPTLTSGAPWGPWEVRPYKSVRVNRLGCLENLHAGAGQKDHDYASCIEHLCEPCSPRFHDGCTVTARLDGRCEAWGELRATELSEHPELLSCFYETGSGWIQHALSVAKMWCGPPSDPGTDSGYQGFPNQQ